MKFLAGFVRRPFVRNVAAVASGTAASQLITMAAAPVITRLYGPEAFGVQGIFMSLLSIAGPLAALTYPVAIVLPKSDEVARALALISLMIAGTMSLLILMLIVLWGDGLVQALGIGAIGVLMYALPVAMFFTGLFQTANQWLIRTSQFKVSAKAAIAGAFVSNASRIALGFFAPVAGSLVLISSLTPAVQSAFIGAGMGRERSLFGSVSGVRFVHLVKAYKDFPLFRAPEAVLSAASIALPTVLLGTLHSAEAAGFYALARTVMKMPGTLMAKSVGDVLYPRYAQARDGAELRRLLFGSVKALALACALPFGLIGLAGPWLFEFAFGDGWEGAGVYAQWVAVWLYVNFSLSPATQMFPVVRRQKLFLAFRAASVIATTSALLVGLVLWSSDITAVMLYCTTGAAMTIAMFVLALSQCSPKTSGGEA